MNETPTSHSAEEEGPGIHMELVVRHYLTCSVLWLPVETVQPDASRVQEERGKPACLTSQGPVEPRGLRKLRIMPEQEGLSLGCGDMALPRSSL